MKLVDHRSTSPRVTLNESLQSSSNSFKSLQKQKILVIILDENDNQQFEEFCLQIYNQSIYLAHKNITPILLCESYSQYSAIEKDSNTEFYILCSQKSIDQPIANKQHRQSLVVYDSGSKGSRKKILDMPNVVYYTKEVQSLRSKLQSRNFISKQMLINEKYRRVYEKNQRKVQNMLINPIQQCINDSEISFKNNLESSQTGKSPSLIEALKSFEYDQIQSIQNDLPRGKIIMKQKSNIKQVPAENFSPSTHQSSEQINFQQQHINGYFQQILPQVLQTQLYRNYDKDSTKRIKQSQQLINQEYSNCYIGPGSDRIIDLTQYQKFKENGVFVYRKKSPSKYYFQPSQNFEKRVSLQIPNPHLLRNPQGQTSDNYVDKKQAFNPQNATCDHYVVQDDLKPERNKIKKPYRTCDSDFHISSKQFDLNYYDSRQINAQSFQSFKDQKAPKRTSDEIKNYLDTISSYQHPNFNNDYQIEPINKNNQIISKFYQNLSNLQSLNKPPFPAYSQSHARRLLRRERPKSQAKVNSFINRFVESDILNQNQHNNFSKSNFQAIKLLNTDQGSHHHKHNEKKLTKSATSRGPHRPLLKSSQKRHKKFDFGNQKCRLTNYQQRVDPSNIIQQENGNIDGNAQKSNKVRLSSKKSGSLADKYDLKKRQQEISVLYLVDHLMDKQILIKLQQMITTNDSVYRWKNLSQLSNQVYQSVQVYDLIFVFKEQQVIEQELQNLSNINPACYLVELNLINFGIQIYRNKLKIRKLNQFQNALKIILQQKFPIKTLDNQ